MAQSFKLPDLGEGIHEGEITAVLVAVGDRVTEGQPILEVETDKANVEIPSPFTGTVEEIKAKPGDVVKVGSVLMVFAGAEENSLAAASAAPSRDGAVAKSAVEEGARDEVGAAAPKRGEGPVPASPATRRLARELGVDLRQVPASGPAGLVTAEDVRAHAAGRVRQAESAAPAHAEPTSSPRGNSIETAPTPADVASAPALPDFSRWGPVERLPLRSVRRATAAHMTLAWSQIPHVNHQELADITRLEAFRKQHAADVDALGGKLTLTVFVMKAVASALKLFPRFNSSLDVQAQEIVLKHYYHLGVAVDTERGLIVPVVRDVDRKSLTELCIELKEMAQRCRAGETPLEEMQGGTFTITNIGALGGTGFSPIVNYPQVAILGMGRARLQPVVLGDENDYQIVPRLMMPLILAFDHRVLDGADSARFVSRIKESLEDPDKLWLRI